ncbi:MAG: phage portal protein [Clostridia bacterium]|nr:phage portal protein [Clostridia bacterium]
MGLFNFFKKPPKQHGTTYAPTMTGATPFYSDFGADIYASDIVMQAISRSANEFKKLQPRHIKTVEGLQKVITDSSIAKVLRRPNPLMSQADFFEKIRILLELNKNVFIYPEWYISKGNDKIITALWPLKPSAVSMLVDAGGRYFYALEFSNGYKTEIAVENIIHWRKDFYDDYFGGRDSIGGERGTLRMLREYDKLTQSIAKAAACSCTVNGLVKSNTYLSDDEQIAKEKDFVERLQNNESGILFTDLKTEYQAISRDIKIVDAETLKFFHECIMRATGCSLPILNGTYTKAEKEAYYESFLEADIKSLGQALSNFAFSEKSVAHGNEIVLYPNDIAFMSMENKLAALQAGLPAGIFTKNEARELLGYAPIEGGDVMPRGYNEIDNAGNSKKEENDNAEE